MRRTVALGVVALCLSGTGCALVRDAVCLTTYRMRAAVRDCDENIRNRKWADQVWDQVRQNCPAVASSHDYAAGFKDGYAHYMYRGGNGEPPPLPPKHYRAIRYQTPQGYRAIEDWFAGFRHGAAVASQSGYRRWVTGPSSLTSSDVAQPAPEVVEPAVYGPALPPVEVVVPPPAEPERLDAPRPVGTAEPLPGVSINVKPLIDLNPRREPAAGKTDTRPRT